MSFVLWLIHESYASIFSNMLPCRRAWRVRVGSELRFAIPENALPVCQISCLRRNSNGFKLASQAEYSDGGGGRGGDVRMCWASTVQKCIKLLWWLAWNLGVPNFVAWAFAWVTRTLAWMNCFFFFFRVFGVKCCRSRVIADRHQDVLELEASHQAKHHTHCDNNHQDVHNHILEKGPYVLHKFFEYLWCHDRGDEYG